MRSEGAPQADIDLKLDEYEAREAPRSVARWLPLAAMAAILLVTKMFEQWPVPGFQETDQSVALR